MTAVHFNHDEDDTDPLTAVEQHHHRNSQSRFHLNAASDTTETEANILSSRDGAAASNHRGFGAAEPSAYLVPQEDAFPGARADVGTAVSICIIDAAKTAEEAEARLLELETFYASLTLESALASASTSHQQQQQQSMTTTDPASGKLKLRPNAIATTHQQHQHRHAPMISKHVVPYNRRNDQVVAAVSAPVSVNTEALFAGVGGSFHSRLETTYLRQALWVVTLLSAVFLPFLGVYISDHDGESINNETIIINSSSSSFLNSTTDSLGPDTARTTAVSVAVLSALVILLLHIADYQRALCISLLKTFDFWYITVLHTAQSTALAVLFLRCGVNVWVCAVLFALLTPVRVLAVFTDCARRMPRLYSKLAFVAGLAVFEICIFFAVKFPTVFLPKVVIGPLTTSVNLGIFAPPLSALLGGSSGAIGSFCVRNFIRLTRGEFAIFTTPLSRVSFTGHSVLLPGRGGGKQGREKVAEEIASGLYDDPANEFRSSHTGYHHRTSSISVASSRSTFGGGAPAPAPAASAPAPAAASAETSESSIARTMSLPLSSAGPTSTHSLLLGGSRRHQHGGARPLLAPFAVAAASSSSSSSLLRGSGVGAGGAGGLAAGPDSKTLNYGTTDGNGGDDDDHHHHHHQQQQLPFSATGRAGMSGGRFSSNAGSNRSSSHHHNHHHHHHHHQQPDAEIGLYRSNHRFSSSNLPSKANSGLDGGDHSIPRAEQHISDGDDDDDFADEKEERFCFSLLVVDGVSSEAEARDRAEKLNRFYAEKYPATAPFHCEQVIEYEKGRDELIAAVQSPFAASTRPLTTVFESFARTVNSNSVAQAAWILLLTFSNVFGPYFPLFVHKRYMEAALCLSLGTEIIMLLLHVKDLERAMLARVVFTFDFVFLMIIHVFQLVSLCVGYIRLGVPPSVSVTMFVIFWLPRILGIFAVDCTSNRYLSRNSKLFFTSGLAAVFFLNVLAMRWPASFLPPQIEAALAAPLDLGVGESLNPNLKTMVGVCSGSLFSFCLRNVFRLFVGHEFVTLEGQLKRITFSRFDEFVGSPVYSAGIVSLETRINQTMRSVAGESDDAVAD